MEPPAGGGVCPVLRMAPDLEVWLYEHFEGKLLAQ